jgi:epoxyqueuosine reductase
MDYLRRSFEKRIDPASAVGGLPGARSVIVVGLNYKPAKSQVRQEDGRAVGRVAAYAQYEDYHGFIRRMLEKLIERIRLSCDANARFKICVDAEPLAERALAARAGLGFIGKNHVLTNLKIGPQILLGEVMTTLSLEADEPSSPASSGCLKCDRCVAACPTGALRADGQFDARRCISYLTIEYKGQIAPELAEKVGNRVFGCEECILACPYQQRAPICVNTEFKFYSSRAQLDLRAISDLTQQEFDAEFLDSPIRRLGLEGLKRNGQICIENIRA